LHCADTSLKELILHPDGTAKSSPTILYVEPFKVDGNQSNREPSGLLDYWYLISGRLPLIGLMVVAGIVLATFWSLWQEPVYQARLTLEIQNPNENALSVKIGGLEADGASTSPEAYLPTQAQILQSLTLRTKSLNRLRAQAVQAPTSTRSRASQLLGKLGLTSSSPAKAPLPSQSDVKIHVQESTRIVEVLVDSTNPTIAASYANALAREYIESNLQSRRDAITKAQEFLRAQSDELKGKLQNSEREAQAYGRASNLMFTGGNSSVEQDRLKQTQEALSQAQAARIEKQSAYQMVSSSTADSVPQVIDNVRLSDYQSQLATLRRQLAELNAQFTPEHPKVKQLRAQIEDLDATFKKERDNILVRVRNEYQAALTRERLLSAAYQKQSELVSRQAEQTTNYNILEREAETNRQLYDSLLKNAKEADIASAMRGSNARVIDAAEPPSHPYKPNFVWNILMGAFSGGIAGIVLVLGRQSLDRSLRGPDEVAFHLDLPELGVIPSEDPSSNNGHGSRNAAGLLPYDGEKGPVGRVETTTWRDKSSFIAEAFRSTCTSILFSSEQGASPRVILICSAARGEGKTTVVSNLGIALGEINRRVLLIDADMRQPRLNWVFGVPNTWGLSDLLREKGSLRDCPIEALAQKTEIQSVYVLPSGPRIGNVTSLLHSARMLELLQRLRSEFDFILIDTPPLLGISDTRVLGRLVDAAVLVFRAGKTNRDVALAAKQRLTADGIPVIGTILNAWDLKTMNRYGYGAYAPYESQ
jgi:succinoglycan biosynthesis transport protein ExoP